MPYHAQLAARPEHPGHLGNGSCGIALVLYLGDQNDVSSVAPKRISYAVPSCARVSGSEVRSTSSISGIGSTATTSKLCSTRRVVSLPVSAPRSGTLHAPVGTASRSFRVGKMGVFA